MMIQISIETAQFIWNIFSKYTRMKLEEVTAQEKLNSSDVKKEENQNTELDDNESAKCQLCFDTLKDASATPCGHIFCWECIVKSCFIKQECPKLS